MANQALVEAIKQMSSEAVQAGNPSDIVYGIVISEEPLKIQINNKLILDEDFLVLTKNVIDYKVKISMNFKGNPPGSISINGTSNTLEKLKYEEGTAIIKNGLKTGDKAIMIQAAGGQKYVVIDKLNDLEEGD